MRVRTCWEASNACPISSRMSIVWRPHGKKTRSRSVRNSRTLTPDATWKKYAVYHRVTPPTGGKVSRTTDSSTNTPDVNSSACSRTPTIVSSTERFPMSVTRIRSPGTARRPPASPTNWLPPAPPRAPAACGGFPSPTPPTPPPPAPPRAAAVLPAALFGHEPNDARAGHGLGGREVRNDEQGVREHRDG